MAIRITNQMMANTMLSNSNYALTNMYKIQNQITTGKKFLSASENPVDASQIIKINVSLGQLGDWKKNSFTAKEELNMAYDALAGVQNSLQRINELSVGLASGLNSDFNFKAYLQEINEHARTISGLANTQYMGNFIFGGTNTLNPPYSVDDNMNVTYNGTVEGEIWERKTEIGYNEEISLNLYGKDIFGDDSGGIFAAVKQLNDIVAVQPVDIMAISETLKSIQDCMDKVSESMSVASLRVNRLDTIESVNTSLITTLTKTKANLHETDLIEATSQFALHQAAMEATLKIGANMLNGPSLLNYI